MQQLAPFNCQAPLGSLFLINPVRTSIARITDDELTKMTAKDLIDLLMFSGWVPEWADLMRDLPKSGRGGLQLLALLARRRCREELNVFCEGRGLPAPCYVSAAV